MELGAGRVERTIRGEQKLQAVALHRQRALPGMHGPVLEAEHGLMTVRYRHNNRPRVDLFIVRSDLGPRHQRTD